MRAVLIYKIRKMRTNEAFVDNKIFNAINISQCKDITYKEIKKMEADGFDLIPLYLHFDGMLCEFGFDVDHLSEVGTGIEI